MEVGLVERVNRTEHHSRQTGDDRALRHSARLVFRTVLSPSGGVSLGIGEASGEKRSAEVTQQAIASLLSGAQCQPNMTKGLFVIFTVSHSTRMQEISDGMSIVRAHAWNDAEIMPSHVFDEEMGDRMRVTVISDDAA